MFHPTTFGKYFLTRRIAVGGMAEVFGAKLYGADGFEKDLVIKQILPQYANDPEFVQSFVAEAKIAVSLTHANVVSIYELGRVDGTYFIAMEFVDGQDVFALLDASRRQDDPLEPGLALLIVEEVARGLDYAHRKLGPDGLPLGLVHRDLNPRNVLVSREGDVKILDFGIAKTASKSAAMPKTRAGVVKGTTGYMSPEQATGQAIDLRTDLYQAGLLLYECLTSRPLFWRPEDHLTRELMRRHEIVPPSRKVPRLPPEVDDLVLTSLRVRPEERFQSAGELAAAVARVRAIRYPGARHAELGTWVCRLLDRDRAAARALEDDIPATADFSEVISQAIEQSITGRFETIATRAPSGQFVLPRRPTTGSQPLDARTITGDVTPMGSTPAPVAPAAVADNAPLTRGPNPDATPWPPEPTAEHRARRPVSGLADVRPRRLGWLVLALLAAIAASAVALALAVTEKERTEAPPEVPTPSQNPPPSEAEPSPEAEAAIEAPSVVPVVDPLREPRPQGQSPAPPSAAAVADFGARPCPARVSLDGRLLGHTTPIFDHPLPAGRHRLVMVADGCPLDEAPGTLEPKRRRLSLELEAPPGARLKVVADFEGRRIQVRKADG